MYHKPLCDDPEGNLISRIIETISSYITWRIVSLLERRSIIKKMIKHYRPEFVKAVRISRPDLYSFKEFRRIRR